MANTQPTLTGLASKITELSSALAKYLEDNNIPAPTFAADSPTNYPHLSPEIFMLRQELLDVLSDMSYLTQGPSESIFNYVHNCMPDVAALNILNHFDFWSAVPVDGSASYEEIAKHVSLPEDVVYRVIQHAVTQRIFAETQPGKLSSQIIHTSRSVSLAKSSGLRALVSTILDDAGPPMVVMNEALQRYSHGKSALTEDMKETAFALFHQGGTFGKHITSWDLLENDGEGDKKGWRQKNFVEFMRYIKEIFHLENVILDFLDWNALEEATVVDVGGSAGHDSIVLARKFPKLKMTVQDLGKVKPVFDADLPEDVKSRVSFMEHSFFDQQPVQADVYVFKMILHDWPNQEAVKILRALVPALKPGARVIVFEYIGTREESDGPLLPRSMQQYGTSTDLRLMALFNCKERPVEAWKEVFRMADERFEVSPVKFNPKQPFFATIEAIWRE